MDLLDRIREHLGIRRQFARQLEAEGMIIS
jgi:hypothetical protein